MHARVHARVQCLFLPSRVPPSLPPSLPPFLPGPSPLILPVSLPRTHETPLGVEHRAFKTPLFEFAPQLPDDTLLAPEAHRRVDHILHGANKGGAALSGGGVDK